MAKSDYLITLNGYKVKDNESIHELSVKDKDILITKGDGTISKITPPDTTYLPVTPNSSTPGLMTGADKYKLDNINEGAEINQNAFSNVTDGSTNISASSKTDTLKIVGTGLIQVAADANNKQITISTSSNDYVLPVATDTTLGGVVIGTGISVAPDGRISNAGVRNVTTDNTSKNAPNGTLTFDIGGATTSVPVKGLGLNAYTSTNFAPNDSPNLTGTPTAPTAGANSNTNQIANTAFVQAAIDNKLAANDAMVFKGTIGTDGTISSLPTPHSAGWTYKVVTAGTYAGKTCEVGDMIICITDGSSVNNNDWTIVQTNIDGAVTGPATATNNAVAIFDNSGRVIKDSTYTIQTSVPPGAVFTDHITTATESGTGNGVASVTADEDGNLTVTKANFLTETDISSKADKVTGITAGTAGQPTDSSGNTVKVPYININGQGLITGYGNSTHTIPGMTGASATTEGTAGLVPKPITGANIMFLRGDAQWATISLGVTDDGLGNINLGLVTN